MKGEQWRQLILSSARTLTFSCNITSKVLEYGLEKEAEEWTGTWLNCWAQGDEDQGHKVQLEANPQLCGPGVTIVISTVIHLCDWPG